MSETEYDGNESGKAVAIYVLYLVALFTGVPFFIGVILAYLFRGSAPAWAASHFDQQISLFWRLVIGSVVLGILMGIALTLSWVLIGIPFVFIFGLMFLYLFIWILVRCLRGISAASKGLPYPGAPGWGL